MSPVFYGLIGMVGVGILNVLIALLNRKHDAFKVASLIQLGNFLLTLSLFPFLFQSNPGLFVFLGLIIAGASGMIAFIFINKAFKEGKTSINSPIISTWGMITAVLGFVLLGEEVYASKIIALLLIVAGIFTSSLDFSYLAKHRNLALIPGIKWSLLAALSLGISFFTIAYFTGENHWYSISLFTRFWTISTCLVIAKATHKPVFSYFKAIPLLVLLAVIVDTGSMLAINIGYTTSEPGVVSLLTSASPIPTIILSFFILKEKITKQQLFGISMVIGGIILLAVR